MTESMFVAAFEGNQVATGHPSSGARTESTDSLTNPWPVNTNEVSQTPTW